MRTILAESKLAKIPPPKTNNLTEYQNPRNKTQPSNDNNPASKKKPHKPSLPIAKKISGCCWLWDILALMKYVGLVSRTRRKKGRRYIAFLLRGFKTEAYYWRSGGGQTIFAAVGNK